MRETERERDGDSRRLSVNELMLLTLLFGKNDRFQTLQASQSHVYFSKQARVVVVQKTFLKGLGLEV